MPFSLPQLTSLLLANDPGRLRELLRGLRDLGAEEPGLLVAQQLAQLDALLALLSRHPFWAPRLASLPKPLTWSAFERLPLLEKTDLAAHGSGLEFSSTPPAFRPTSEVTTSGSTGTPVTTRGCFATGFLARALQLRFLGLHHFHFEGTTLFLVAPKSSEVKRKLEEGSSWATPLGTGKSLHFDLRASEDEQLAAIAEARPRYLSTYPSNLARLLDRLAEKKETLAGLEKIVLSSEPISDELVSHAEELTGAKVLRTYSASEVGLIAYEDPEGSALLVASESVLVEILRDDGSKAALGELGRVVVTTLQDLLRPLVRYAIGDYAAMTLGEDGRPRITRIAGRERSMVRLPDGRRVWPYFRFELLGNERPFSSWQLRQKADLSLVVSIVPRAGYDDSSREAIERVVREALPDLPIEIVAVGELARAKNGKFLEVLSEAE